MKYSIIIPTWNGKKLLQKNFPKVLSAVADQKAEVIVVDDGSTDGTTTWLESQSFISTIRIVEITRNQGFSNACNQGVKKAQGGIIVLLNNDVVPKKDFLNHLEKYFSNPNIFAVSFNEIEGEWGGPPKAGFKNGFLHYTPGKRTKKPVKSLWASGGGAAFSRKIWQKLEGFDLLFSPFYWEDVDLCYRAWKRGYQVFWEPESKVSHKHESTIGRLSKSYVDLIKQRNELLFLWKNITDKNLVSEHKKYLFKRLIKNPGYAKILTAALVKLPEVLSKRQKEKSKAKLTDKQVFKKLKD